MLSDQLQYVDNVRACLKPRTSCPITAPGAHNDQLTESRSGLSTTIIQHPSLYLLLFLLALLPRSKVHVLQMVGPAGQRTPNTPDGTVMKQVLHALVAHLNYSAWGVFLRSALRYCATGTAGAENRRMPPKGKVSVLAKRLPHGKAAGLLGSIFKGLGAIRLALCLLCSTQTQ